MAKKSWAELSPIQQKSILAAAALEVVVTSIAMRDLRRRPHTQVRGPKVVWLLLQAVQPFGPIAYLLLGRRTHRS